MSVTEILHQSFPSLDSEIIQYINGEKYVKFMSIECYSLSLFLAAHVAGWSANWLHPFSARADIMGTMYVHVHVVHNYAKPEHDPQSLALTSHMCMYMYLDLLYVYTVCFKGYIRRIVHALQNSGYVYTFMLCL